ncbi:LysM peptidoglycan-binding domain-containing protein [Mycobacterium sp. ACS4331]|uniref:LysM peptidoglycan-binding domain-containing protein n=1 Tax=Mycobacterium sp. ACS4331 TaxID=1834121 RepID=UPI0007FDBBD3|nr:LysM peptidoglycan-binding domain-containing protein [Mycobacterium sp. ACS4331]OBF19415.1 hypothetical protein A5727_10465 [Mycobacterium sp. ACS4331]
MASLHHVASGDTLRSLARRFFADQELAGALAAANGLAPSDELVVGQDLLVPYITRRHLVSEADTLFDLAELYYGDGAMFPALAAANHIAAPYLLAQGQDLLIPDLVNVSHHIVYPGDTLRDFAIRWYNDERCDVLIEYANHLASPDDIEVGQKLIRPALNRRHIVEEFETWEQMSQRWYGDPRLQGLIAAANHLPVEKLPPVGQTVFFPDLAEF